MGTQGCRNVLWYYAVVLPSGISNVIIQWYNQVVLSRGIKLLYSTIVLCNCIFQWYYLVVFPMLLSSDIIIQCYYYPVVLSGGIIQWYYPVVLSHYYYTVVLSGTANTKSKQRSYSEVTTLLCTSWFYEHLYCTERYIVALFMTNLLCKYIVSRFWIKVSP